MNNNTDEDAEMPTRERAARIAGVLYLQVAMIGPFVLLYVPNRLFVAGDATATATNILAHQGLFQAYIALSLVTQILFITVVLLLYRILREVQPTLAIAMVALILLDAPLAFLGIANDVATLSFLRGGAAFLNVFDEPQRHALATLLIHADRAGVLVSQVFWGLWLLPLGVLVHRSGDLPRWLGVWLVLNGVTYVLLSGVGLVAPAAAPSLFRLATPLLCGELALALWMLVRGLRPAQATAAA